MFLEVIFLFMSHSFNFSFHKSIFSTFKPQIPLSAPLWRPNHLFSEQAEEREVAWNMKDKFPALALVL